MELEFPTVVLSFREKTHTQKLTEADVLHLTKKNFHDWKQNLMASHFRLELNIPAGEPLPLIQEVKRGEEEDFISEGDPAKRFPVQADEK